ncbi:redoxin family protein [Flaviflexus huanghaiensis]|uniref:redoxin family protein n=1 Tax=Flaviflexus huanghaiensis TaxID=1111473 RepID=UPI0015F7AA98
MRRLVWLLLLPLLAGCNSAIEGTEYTGRDANYVMWPEAERGEPVEASGVTFDGDEVNLADLRGNVVVINTWYAACPPCRAEAADLNAIAEDYAGDVTVIGVNTRDNKAAAEAFERSFGTPYESIEGRNGEFISGLEGAVPLQAVPTTLILDTEGRPAARYLGQIDPQIVRGMIDDSL